MLEQRFNCLDKAPVSPFDRQPGEFLHHITSPQSRGTLHWASAQMCYLGRDFDYGNESLTGIIA